ncbi:uncharacterized protein FIBRA_05065 [Fibroporia radiculosa]|uniref:Uncharacterized protein n=1 Tax=Fibroporia radiculosa TaxID=599839 RepID=J4GQC0_9APHY|nr:uncharacterized protein FIBRA_05065 [Fibroporia radiculosa]CCM02950.1 predicted protein [Fibroporia radiculosa]
MSVQDPIRRVIIEPIGIDSVGFIDALSKEELNTASEWCSVLKLATPKGFADIRTFAVKKRLPMFLRVEQVVLAHNHELEDLLLRVRKRFGERTESVSF